VVPVAHRQCRQHEWMGKRQWRLSFSRAEIVLINSWSPVQQITYHMLRYFVKTERLTDCVTTLKQSLSNYHIKTLMLWASEIKSSSWWTDDINLVRICVQLLHILADWLTNGHCPHYFINCGNLVDSSYNLTNIRNQLILVDETWLSKWFVRNYIQKCLQVNDCPQNISRLFDDVTTRGKLQNGVSALLAWRQNISHLNFWAECAYAEFDIPSCVYDHPLTARSYICCMTQWTAIDSCFSVYFRAVALLHVASRLLKHGLNNKLMDILATICGLQFADIRRNSYHSTSVLSLDIAGKLMKVVANESLSTMSLIEIELSKAYLYRALRCKDSDSNSIYCLANVYLAVLFYTTGQYQKAIDHCTLVTRSQDHSHCSSNVVQGKMLPKFDDNVDSMLGLAELYQSVRTAALKQQQQPQFLSVFTTKLFAYYLHAKYLAVKNYCQFRETLSSDEFKWYEICISNSPQLFISDVLLFLSVSQLLKCRCKSVWLNSERSVMNAKKCNTSDLVELLQKSAVEHLTAYRQLLAQDFGSIDITVTTDFKALYAYKCGDYQQCLQFCTQNVHRLFYAVCMPNVLTFPEFIQLMDDDIVSLTALTLIVDSKCRENSFGNCILQVTLSLYLMTQCQLKLHHSVTSLAQTLDYIKVAQKRLTAETRSTLNQLTLKLTESKLKTSVNVLL